LLIGQSKVYKILTKYIGIFVICHVFFYEARQSFPTITSALADRNFHWQFRLNTSQKTNADRSPGAGANIQPGFTNHAQREKE